MMPQLTPERQVQITRFEERLDRWTAARKNRGDAEELELAKKAVYAALEEKTVEPAVDPGESSAPKAVIPPPPEL